MKKIFSFLRDFLSVVLVLSIAFGAGYFFCYISRNTPSDVSIGKKDKFNLELPLEVEKKVVTVDEIKAKLVKIGDLSTYSGEYTCTLGKDETRYMLKNIPVLGSTNSITITCNGIVKVGYEIADIDLKVVGNKIYISVPEAQLNDNYIIWDSVQCSESNNILNPIEFAQYREIIDEIESKGLEQVASQGIYEKAEKNLKSLIMLFLSEFSEYEVVFV